MGTCEDKKHLVFDGCPRFHGKNHGNKTCFCPAFATSPSGHWNSPKEHPLLEIDEQNSHRLTLEI
jgi:hypothetical protein